MRAALLQLSFEFLRDCMMDAITIADTSHVKEDALAVTERLASCSVMRMDMHRRMLKLWEGGLRGRRRARLRVLSVVVGGQARGLSFGITRGDVRVRGRRRLNQLEAISLLLGRPSCCGWSHHHCRCGHERRVLPLPLLLPFPLPSLGRMRLDAERRVCLLRHLHRTLLRLHFEPVSRTAGGGSIAPRCQSECRRASPWP